MPAVNRRNVGLIMLVAGIVVLLISVTADVTGLGGEPGFGRIQMAGTILGAIVAIVGGVLYSRRQPIALRTLTGGIVK